MSRLTISDAIIRYALLIAFIPQLSTVSAQCQQNYIAFYGDTPANSPNAIIAAGVNGVTTTAMTGGAGITLNNVSENGASVFQMVNLNQTTFANAVTDNDYISTTLSLGATYNRIRLSAAEIRSVGSNFFANNPGRGDAQWGLVVRNVSTGVSTTLFSNVNVTNGATSNQAAATPYEMLPGFSYEIRFYVYNLTNPGSTTRSYDNPVLYFQMVPNLSALSGTFCQGNTFNLGSLVLNTNVTYNNANILWYTNAALTTLVGNASAVGAGTYYVSYRDNNLNCNYPALGPITITQNNAGCPDTDNDGIPNSADIDDDNDGILDNIECGINCNDPFINGGFEFPDIANSTNVNQSTVGIGWQTSAADGLIELWNSGFNGVPSAEGTQFAELNATQSSTLYQTFCVNGQGGTVYWAVKHRGRSGTDVAAVKMGSTLAAAVSSAAIQTMTDGNTAWGAYSGVTTFAPGATTLVIAFQAVSSNGGDPSFGNFIDDVQITLVQNCSDTDGDGIQNSLDIDSDNDCIVDNREAQNQATYIAPTGLDMDGDGLDNAYETNGLTPINSDGNGNPNYLDIDSDNDGIVDNSEAQATFSYVAPTGLDADGDGLDNAYDGFNGFGGAGVIPVNTEGSDNPDYTDLDSDNDGITDVIEGWDTDGNGAANTVASGTDSDGDGLDNAYDVNDAGFNPTNGTTPLSYPNVINTTSPQRDWRELASTLAVDLIQFNGSCLDQKVILNWIVLNEVNTDHYEIEIEDAGTTVIDSVPAMNEIGIQTYSVEYADRKKGLFHLVEVDQNGERSTKGTLYINCSGFSEFITYSNNSLMVAVDAAYDAEEPVNIYDVSGRVVFESVIGMKKGENTIVIPGIDLSNTFYLVELGTGPNHRTAKLLPNLNH